MLNDIEEMLAGQHSESDPKPYGRADENEVILWDTPRIWGIELNGMNKYKLATQALEVVAAFSTRIENMLKGSKKTIYFSTLDAPQGDFSESIIRGVIAALRSAPGIDIRMVFGWVPLVGMFDSWRGELALRLKEAFKTTSEMKGTLRIAQLCQRTQWNHSKIIACDKQVSIVGGHNLWQSSYMEYPPVHDVSLEVRGPGAAVAHDFLELLWDRMAGTASMPYWSLDDDFKWQKGDGKNPKAPQEESSQKQQDVIAVKIRLRESNELSSELLPNQNPIEVKLQLKQNDDLLPEDGGSAGGVNLGRGSVLGVGRTSSFTQQHGFLVPSASDLVKQWITQQAKTSLKLCQQDLVMKPYGGLDKSHLVCGWIAEALLDESRPDLEIHIVVSPVCGWGGGAQYSWGSGARGTYGLIKEKLQALSGGSTQSKEQEAALKRLTVAPFCFGPIPKDITMDESVWEYNYSWPGMGVKAHFRPRAGAVAPELFWKPAPGNHSKVYIVDDSVAYVGSDNLYPHDLVEYGYLVEGDVARALVANYWDEVWKYSEPHRVK